MSIDSSSPLAEASVSVCTLRCGLADLGDRVLGAGDDLHLRRRGEHPAAGLGDGQQRPAPGLREAHLRAVDGREEVGLARGLAGAERRVGHQHVGGRRERAAAPSRRAWARGRRRSCRRRTCPAASITPNARRLGPTVKVWPASPTSGPPCIESATSWRLRPSDGREVGLRRRRRALDLLPQAAVVGHVGRTVAGARLAAAAARDREDGRDHRHDGGEATHPG